MSNLYEANIDLTIGGDKNWYGGATLRAGDRVWFDGTVIEVVRNKNHFTNPTLQKAIDAGLLTLVGSSDAANRVVTTSDATWDLENWQSHLILTSTTARTVNLPASPDNSQAHTIKDGGDNASVGIITINGNGNLIDGLASQALDIDSGALSVFYDGSAWWFM